jgi:hypothetical protein
MLNGEKIKVTNGELNTDIGKVGLPERTNRLIKQNKEFKQRS